MRAHQRDLYSAKHTCGATKETDEAAKETYLAAKEIYFGAKQADRYTHTAHVPHIKQTYKAAKETYKAAKETYKAAKETYIAAKETYLVAKKTCGCVHTRKKQNTDTHAPRASSAAVPCKKAVRPRALSPSLRLGGTFSPAPLLIFFFENCRPPLVSSKRGKRGLHNRKRGLVQE